MINKKTMFMKNITADGQWKETNHGRTMSNGIKLLLEENFFENKTVLELGTGIANHARLVLNGNVQHLTCTEINQDRLDFSKKIIENEFADLTCFEFCVADWLALEGKHDIVMTNPPYFASGKQNRRYFIDELILNSHKRLHPNGHLLFIQSSMADIKKTKNRMIENGFTFKIIFQDSFKWRNYYYNDLAFLKMCDDNPESYYMKENERWEILYVVVGKLKPFSTKFRH